jgi:dihydroneopterin aldolase
MTASDSSVRVTLADFEIHLALGLHPWERHKERPTRLLVSVELELPLARYYGEANGYIDYDPLYAYIATWPGRPHTERIETLAEELLDFLFAKTPASRARVNLRKPDIFVDVSAVGVSYDVSREDWDKLRGARNG